AGPCRLPPAPIRRAEAMVLHLRWLRANAELEAAVERLRAVEGQVGELTMSTLAAERAREQAAAVLPGLRQSEAATSAELQRLTLARQTLEDEERRVSEARAAAEGRLNQVAQDRAREATLGADAQSALAALERERRGLVAGQASEASDQAAATAGLRLTSDEVAALDAEIETLTQQAAALEARRETLLREGQDMAARRTRLIERNAELDRQRAALASEALPSGVVESALALVAAAEAEMTRASAA